MFTASTLQATCVEEMQFLKHVVLQSNERVHPCNGHCVLMKCTTFHAGAVVQFNNQDIQRP
ncbi:hypothetical protein GECvBMG_gp196c [Salmonella phage GEC_vB_MG]|nr:hypothetical protein GECvBMG_gp196c [Salmonella phage GEC_vB_MG]